MFSRVVALAWYVRFRSLGSLADDILAARSGSKHLQFLLQNQLINLHPSRVLQYAYTEATMDRSLEQIDKEVKQIALDTPANPELEEHKEQMLMSASSGAVIAGQLGVPEIQMEIDRAVWQVERAIDAQEGRKAAEGNERQASTQEHPERRR